MRLTSRLKRANPLSTEADMSPRGRQELRNLVGLENLEEPTHSTARPLLKRYPWLAPSGAMAILAAVVAFGIGIAPMEVTPVAFADSIESTVYDGTVTVEPWGTSLIVSIPGPSIQGADQSYWVMRLWASTNPGAQWTSLPENVTWKLIEEHDGEAIYRAVDWPWGGVSEVTLWGPESPKCQGNNEQTVSASASSDDTLSMSLEIGFCSEADQGNLLMAQSLVSSPEGDMYQQINVGGTTTDPEALAATLKQFSLDDSGQWESLPSGFEDWASMQNDMTIEKVESGTGYFQWVLSPSGEISNVAEVDSSYVAPEDLPFDPSDPNVVTVMIDDSNHCTVSGSPEFWEKLDVNQKLDEACDTWEMI